MSSPHQTPIGVGIVGLSARRGWASQTHPRLGFSDPPFFGTAGKLAAADGST